MIVEWINWLIAVVLAAAVAENYAKKNRGYPAVLSGILLGALLGVGVLMLR